MKNDRSKGYSVRCDDSEVLKIPKIDRQDNSLNKRVARTVGKA